jgi:serine/threonine protein phosphatase PrpC
MNSFLSVGGSQRHEWLVNFHRNFIEISLTLLRAVYSGSTACVALIIDTTLYVANCGDTRAVLCRGGKPVRLSVDHNVHIESEKQRIISLGGTVNGIVSIENLSTDIITS